VKRVRVRVSGRVQGVFYRATCADGARRLGLGGWVRNLPDGRVEGVFEGPDELVAHVDVVEVTPEPVAGEREFRVTG
jgi:acylphosphatase